eukprot:TRINITY_DN7327_c0_g1_i5.p1 TRINITY_DN7327_c0_g1~~TRINITY_DN7327_c0_g1_i5.p1  ORF type:complete len:702 (+),score=267.13 TRINITY_DN7327_c0_g1_i5:447-2552(+)
MIFDLASCNHQALEFALKSFEMKKDWESKKFVILLSSIMTWAQTPVLYKKEGEGEGEEEEAGEGEQKDEAEPEEDSGEEEEKEEEPEDADKDAAEQEDPVPKKRILPFKESQYYLRIPAPEYASYKFLETLALSIGTTKPGQKPEDKKLFVYVLCAGLLYGNGEDVFYQYFKQAWLQNPQKLPIIGKGNNRVPTIHVVDLARLVKRVIRLTPKQSYVVAVDRSKRPTQKKIVMAISKAIGTGLIESCTSQALAKNPWMLPLQINVKIRSSEAFRDEPTPEEEGDLDPDEAERRAKERRFPWHCEFGIAETVAMLNTEFNRCRELNPVKVFVAGMPASGKSWLSELLAKYYNVPHITWSELQREGKLLQGEFGEEIQKRLEEDKEKKMEEYEQLPKKEKKAVDIDKYEPMIPDEMLYKVLQIKLNSNVCRNRGYVLDNYPKDYKFVQYSFLKPVKKDGEEEPPGEEEIPNFEDYVLATEIAPSSVIMVNASEGYVMERVKNMSEAELAAAGGYTEADIVKRLKEYRSVNEAEDGSYSLIHFFHERNVEVLKVNAETQSKELIVSKSKVFIERNGKPKNYMTEDEEKEKVRLEELRKLQEKKALEFAQKQAQSEITEQQLKQQKKIIDEKRTERYQQQEKEMLDSKAGPIRDAIMETIGDILTDGIVDVCVKKPEDPVEHLAKYLFRRSLEVKGKFITLKKAS